jgi:hypothetical protein
MKKKSGIKKVGKRHQNTIKTAKRGDERWKIGERRKLERKIKKMG